MKTQKDLTIALTIALKNSQQISKELENAGKKIKPIKVRLEADSPVLQDGKVKLDGDFAQIGQKIGSFASEQISDSIKNTVSQTPLRISDADADRVAKKFTNSISDGIKDSLDGALRNLGRGNVFGAAASLASAPLKIAGNLATTALSFPARALGEITRGISDGLTEELVRGVGAGLRQSAEQKLSNVFGSSELFGKNAANLLLDRLGQAAQGIEQQLEREDSPLKGVSKVLQSEFKKLIANAFDPQEVLAESRAAQRRARAQRSATEVDAAEELNLERQQSYRRLQDFREQAARLKAENAAQEQEFIQRSSPTYKAAQQTIKTVEERAQVPTERLQQVQAEREGLVGQIGTARGDEKTRIRTRFDELTTEARSLEAEINGLQQEYDQAAKTIADIQSEAEAISSRYQRIDAIQRKLIDQAKAAARAAKSVGTPQEQRTVLTEDIASVEKQIAAAQVEQKSIIEQRAELIAFGKQQAQKAQQAYASNDQDGFVAYGAIADRTQQLIQRLEQGFESLNKTKQELEARAEKLRSKLKATPEALPAVVQQAYRELGVPVPETEQTPAVRERSSTTLGVAKAQFGGAENTLEFRAETLQALKEAQSFADLTVDQLNLLLEEVAHSIQLGYGELAVFRKGTEGSRAEFRRLASDATPQEIAKLLPELSAYQEFDRPIELDAKVARDRAVARELQRRQAQESLASIEEVGYGGSNFTQQIEPTLADAGQQINAILQQATDLGRAEDTALTAIRKFFANTVETVEDIGRRLTQTAIQQPDAEQAAALVADVQSVLARIEQLDDLISRTRSRFAAPPEPEQGGVLTRAGDVATGLAENLQPAGNIILRGAEFAGDALGVVGKAGLALADKIGFAAASLIPGGALLYDPAIKPVAKTAAVGAGLAAASATIPGASEILGTITSTISAILSPATSGLATTIGADVATQIGGALPQLFQSLSGAIASSGLPGAGLTAEAVSLLGGQLTHVLQPVVQGVASTADASIVAVGTAVNQFLGELGTVLLAGKTIETGAKLATSRDAREAALQGIQTVGEGVGQFVGAVPEAIETIQDAVQRTSSAVQRNVEEIKDAGQRLAQGEVSAVGDIVEAGAEAAANIARGASDVAAASTKAAGDIVEGAAKVGGVFGKLASQSIPGVNDLGELSKDQLLSVYNQLSKKLQNVLTAEVEAIERSGSAGTGRSGVIRGDLGRVAEVLQQKYQHTINVIAEEVREDILGEPLQLPARLNLPELQPIEIEVQQPQQEPLKFDLEIPEINLPPVSAQGEADAELLKRLTDLESEVVQNLKIDPPQVTIDIPAIEIPAREVAPAVDDDKLQLAVADLDAEFAGAREEIQKLRDQVYAYVDEAIKTQKAIRKATERGDTAKAGDAERAFREATDEANRYGSQLTARAREIYQEIQNSRKILDEFGVDTTQGSEVGRALDGYKQTLTKSINGVESKLRKIGIDLSAEDLGGIALQSLAPGFDEITTVLRNKAKSLSSALQSLVEIARQNPQIVNTAKDLAVNTAGFVASQSVSDHGAVAQLAADLIAALTARNAIALASGDAPEKGLIEAIQRLTARLNDPKFQDGVGREIFGDILGFLTGNLTNQITGIPGSGAVAAAAIVPRVQQFRDRQQTPDVEGLGDGLAARDPEIEQALEDLRRVAAAADKVDATAGDRIALFFLRLRQAFEQAPTPQASRQVQDALQLLEASIAGVAVQLPQDVDGAIAQSEAELRRIERLLNTAELQAQEVERLAERAETRTQEYNLQTAETDLAKRLTPSALDSADPNQLATGRKERELAQLDAERDRLTRQAQEQESVGLTERLELLQKLQSHEQENLSQRLENIARERAAEQDAFAERLRQQQALGEQERSNFVTPQPAAPEKTVDQRLSEAASQRQVESQIEAVPEPDLGDRLALIQQEQQSKQNTLSDRLAGLQQIAQAEQESYSQRIANAAREREIESEAFSEKLRYEQALGDAERNRAQERQVRATKEERDAIDRRLAEAAQRQPEDLTTRLAQITPEPNLGDRLQAIAQEQQARQEAINERIADAQRVGEVERRQSVQTLEVIRQNLDQVQARREEASDRVTDGLIPRITLDVTPEQRSQSNREALERKATERVISRRLADNRPSQQSLEQINSASEQAIASFEKTSAKFDQVADQVERRFAQAGSKISGQSNVFERVGLAYRRMVERFQDGGADQPKSFFAAIVTGANQAKGELVGLAERIGLPVGAFGKLAGAAKYALIGLLAYAGISTIGDALFQLGRQAFEVSTQFERLKTRVQFTNNGNLEQTQRDIDFVEAEAERIKKPVNEILTAYGQLRVSAKNTPLEGAVTDQVFTALNTLSRTLGFTADQVEGVQTQLGQVFRVGRADTEDLKTIAERGVPIFEKLGQVLGVPLDAVQKKIEAGEVSSQKLAEAFILAGKEAEQGLAAALKTPSAALDDLKRTSESALKGFGEFITPAVIATLSAGGQAIEYLSEAGVKLQPVFDAAGEVIDLIATALSPVTDLIGRIIGSGILELLQGVAIPFQAIAAGVNVLATELKKVYEFFAPVVNAVVEFIDKSGVAQIAVRTLGEVLGIFLIAKTITLAVTITGAVVPALLTMAGTMTATVIPAIVSATTAALAFIATPIGATIAAIGLAAAIAAPNIERISNALSGVDIEGNNRAIEFNREYSEGLTKLQKGIPLTEEELKKLKDGFAENVRTGRDSAQVAQKLTNNLDKLQAAAKNAAPAQLALSKAFEESAKRFEESQKGLESKKLDSEIERNRSLLNSQLSIKDAKELAQREEIQSEQQYNQDLIATYERRNTEIAGLLAQNQALLAGGGLDEKQKEERKKAVEDAQKEQIDNLSKLKQAQLSILKSEQQEREKLEQERIQRVENSQKVIENQIAAGTKRQVDGEIEISDSKQTEINRRIKDIDRALEAEIEANGKASDLAKQLYSERAVLSSEYTKLEAEESNKRYEVFVAEVEKARDKLADRITLSEAETSRDIQQALLAGLDPDEAERRKIQATKTRIQQELALEQAKIQQLAQAPTPASEDKRQEQEKTLRDAKVKTAQLTGQLAEEELKAQEALRKATLERIDEESKALELQSKAVDDRGREIDDFSKRVEIANGIVTRSIERQNALLEQQKSLRDAVLSLAETQYKILEETADSEQEKAKIQERAAKARLDSLRESQRIEAQVLNLQLQQEEAQQRIAVARAASEVEKARLESDKAAIEVERAQLERNKLDENPQATEADKKLADKNIESAQLSQKSASLVEQVSQSALTGEFEKLQLQREQADSKRALAAIARRRDILNARLELAKSRTDPERRDRELESLRRVSSRETRERERDARERESGLRDRTRTSEDRDRDISTGQRSIKTYAPDINNLAGKGIINIPGVKLPDRPTVKPVDLHSGAQPMLDGLAAAIRGLDITPIQKQLGDLLRVETQLSTQIQALANRRGVVQHNQTTNVVQRAPALASGLPV